MDSISEMACPHAGVKVIQICKCAIKFSEKFLCVVEAVPCMGVNLL